MPKDIFSPGVSGTSLRFAEGMASPLNRSGTKTSKPLFCDSSSAVMHGFFVKPSEWLEFRGYPMSHHSPKTSVSNTIALSFDAPFALELW